MIRRKAARRSRGSVPVYEHVIGKDTETFLWRCDDYPWIRNVWNIHPEYEIHLIRNATGVALIGDHIGHFGPGHLSVVGGGLPHDWVTATAPGQVIGGRDIVLQFDPKRVVRAAALLPELARLEPFLIRALRGVQFYGDTRRLGAELLEEMGQTVGLERLCLFIRLLHLLAESSQYEVLSSQEFAPKLDPATLDKVQRALAYVVENYQGDIRLADVAHRLGMTESAFSRFFQKNTGNSFSDHVTKLRIGRACKLLAETEQPVTEICFEIGYLNVSNFNRVFRAQRGITPSNYRRLSSRRMG